MEGGTPKGEETAIQTVARETNHEDLKGLKESSSG
jgi:hypothetical protein